MASTYDKGATVRVFGTFKSTGGTVADPTVVRLKYQKPGTALTTLTYSTSSSSIVRDSTGVYRADLTVDTVGLWVCQFDSSGSVRASEEKRFRVRPGVE